jgi:L-rhamnose mutarotase
MLRKAFRMSVHRGHEAEYERRHRPVWRELEEALRLHGVHCYSIYLDEPTGDLFAYVELEDEDRWRALASTDVCRRWWRHMQEIMPTNPDASPVSRDLREVFHIEAPDPRSDASAHGGATRRDWATLAGRPTPLGANGSSDG